MPTLMTHAVAGVAIAHLMAPRELRRRLSWAAAICSMLPDADVAGFAFGVSYGDLFGHRGITHSVAFAALVAAGSAAWLGRNTRALASIFIATLSHGLLDAMTDGGLGVAFFSPLQVTRYFFGARPIHVSPIGLGFFSSYGLAACATELVWVWFPALILIAAAWWWRARA